MSTPVTVSIFESLARLRGFICLIKMRGTVAYLQKAEDMWITLKLLKYVCSLGWRGSLNSLIFKNDISRTSREHLKKKPAAFFHLMLVTADSLSSLDFCSRLFTMWWAGRWLYISVFNTCQIVSCLWTQGGVWKISGLIWLAELPCKNSGAVFLKAAKIRQLIFPSHLLCYTTRGLLVTSFRYFRPDSLQV